MDIKEAVRIIIDNKPTRKWINPDCDELAEAIEKVAEHFKPVKAEIEGGGSNWWYVCEECRGAIDSSDSWCKHCGRPVEKT